MTQTGVIPDSPNPLDGDRYECPPGMVKKRVIATVDPGTLTISDYFSRGAPVEWDLRPTTKVVETSTDRLDRAVAMIGVLSTQLHEQRTQVRLLAGRIGNLEAQIALTQADS